MGDNAADQTVESWKTRPDDANPPGKRWPKLYVVEEVGEFDGCLRNSTDYDFMLCCFETQAFRSRRIDRVLVDMMAGGASQSGIGAYLRGNLESLRARRKWLGAGAVDFDLFAKPARKVMQWF